MRTKLLTVLALASLFTACGGGDSDGENLQLPPAGTEAAPAPSEGGHTPPEAGELPDSLQARIDTLRSEGVQILRVYSTPYTEAASGAKPAALEYGLPVRPTTDFDLQAFPSGCGLWVLVYRDGNIVYNASSTSCVNPVSRIEMLAGLAWSRWWGWQELYQDEDGVSNRSYLDLTIWVDCSETGTHDYQGVTNGYVGIAGRDYHASAWDQIDRVECG
ncbi:hypothetical protein OOT46_23105 [Aquabacterium sp. A7-Y]|uniref:hypothetical protein n=1 Tax=Aquabacterium sp. A7-Y TaxID=1349605 RepID=UPI00223D3713|nr:hypothetical protein [Aquabacterium sp. A7-Y]MCW7540711.1 hypothetical protein [Aquabacterium sp. A7-Y]